MAPLYLERDKLVQLTDCLTDFSINLDGEWFYSVSKLLYKELLKILHTTKKNLAALQAVFDEVDTKANCKLNKVCYEEDITGAENTFVTMWEKVETLKTTCISK